MTRSAVIALAMLLMASAPSGASASSRVAETADVAAGLESQVEAQVPAMLPEGMRVDRVTLGCKPPAHATLTTFAPG